MADRVGQVRRGGSTSPTPATSGRGRSSPRRGSASARPTRTPPRSPPAASSTGSTPGSASSRRASTPRACSPASPTRSSTSAPTSRPRATTARSSSTRCSIAGLAFPELDTARLRRRRARPQPRRRLPPRRRPPRGLDALPRDRAALVRRRARERPPLRGRAPARLRRARRPRAGLPRPLHPPRRHDPRAVGRRHRRLHARCSASQPDERNVSFPDGGYHVQRSGWDPEARFLIFDCGPLGDGGHGHYDLLSFEAHADGRPLVLDPGRGSYSEAPPNLRRWFRGTAAHNTVTRRRARPDALHARPPGRARSRRAACSRAPATCWRARRAAPPTRRSTAAASRSSTSGAG